MNPSSHYAFMGELSKKIGEEGEATVRHFFESIGWQPLTDGTDLPCVRPKDHKRPDSTGDRTSHGVDLAFSYICPIIPSFRRNILISVKNSKDDETTTLKKRIKHDLIDLGTALACFKRSQMRANFAKAGGGADSAEDIGVLVKINKDPDGEKSFLGDLGAREQMETEGTAPVCFMENARFDFIEHCMGFLARTAPNSEHSFFHVKSSLNMSASSRLTSSKLLPIQDLLGGPLIVKSEEDGQDAKSSLKIFSQQPFSEARFSRLLGLGLDESTNWVNVEILFPDFQEIKHGGIVDQIKTGLANKAYARKIRCESTDPRSRIK